MSAGAAPSLADRSVLVTGADGFIGSHLVEAALAAGANVRAFGLYNSFGAAGWLDESEPFQHAVADGRAELVLGDVRDGEFVDGAVRGTDVVLHLAALIAIPYSYTAPRSYVETNLTGTLNVLEAVRRNGAARMVHTSTSEVYGTPHTVPITERHPLQGQSPYSASKIAADKMCEAFARSFGTPVTVLRPFNTFGPRQSARALIPTVLAQLLVGAQQVKLGATTPRRDFTYVTDTCAGFLRAAVADLEPGATLQLGTGQAYSVAEVVAACQAVTGRTADVVIEADRLRPPGSEIELLLADPAQAAERLGWAATVSFEDGLRRTAEWLASRVDPRTAGRYRL